VLGDGFEVPIRDEQAKLVANAELGEDRVDGADLDATAAYATAELRSLEVVMAIRCDKRQGTETRDDRLLVAGAAKALEEFLVDERRSRDELPLREGMLERLDSG
jgi:hypothetical protein